jgi:hypothetical protein
LLILFLIFVYYQGAVEKTYRTFKQQAAGETPEKQLVVACGFIPAAIEHDKILFLEEFPKYAPPTCCVRACVRACASVS